MIKGVHTMYYSSDADGLRAFLRDKLGFTAKDIGGGWLIFDMPPCEMGVHPADERPTAQSGTHNISFYCDDIGKTVAELKRKGVEFTCDPVDEGFGLVTHFKVPGGFELMLYQPKYEK